VGVVEAFAGIGNTIGPVLGSTLYALMGFSGTFYSYGAMNIVWGAMTYALFPTSTKKTE